MIFLNKLLVLLCLILALEACSGSGSSVEEAVALDDRKCTVYVAALTGKDANSGTAWAEAFATLQHAYDAIPKDPSGPTVICVGEGKYGSLKMSNPNTVFWCGGLSRKESTCKPASSSHADSVLDGDWNQGHVLESNAGNQTFTRFKIQHGDATGVSVTVGDQIFNGGGGVFVNSKSTVILNKVTVSDNTAASENLFISSPPQVAGAGILNLGTLSLKESVVENNNAAIQVSNRESPIGALGGGIYNNGTLTIQEKSVFRKNNVSGLSAVAMGGAIYNDILGKLDIDRSSFESNSSNAGGAIYVATQTLSEQVYISNSIFNKNMANSGSGGSIFNNGALNLSNVTFFNNSSTVNGLAISNGAGSSTCVISNSIFWDLVFPNVLEIDISKAPSELKLSVKFSDIQGGFSGDSSNISEDPQFVDTSKQDFKLLTGSPASGTGQLLSGPLESYWDGTPYGTKVNMGANETLSQ